MGLAIPLAQRVRTTRAEISVIESLLSKAHAARMEVRRIEREMRACVCQHELAADICSERADVTEEPCLIGSPLFLDRNGQEYEFKADDFRPCWKGQWIDCSEERPYYEAQGDFRPGGWCDPCKKREGIRKLREPARRRLAGLKSAIWAAAKKCAENSP